MLLNIKLILKKEDITEEDVDRTKVVVVLDVLLATSTIVTCLANSAKAIYPVISKQEALLMVNELKSIGVKETDIYLAGEENAKMIDGFLNPIPSLLQEVIAKKHLILLTTNGTSAIRGAASAKKVYISSLLNTKAVVQKILNNYDSANITVICSGSNGEFCLEDFYGAGYFINQFTENNGAATLYDGALSAKLFYKSYENQGKEILSTSSVGNLLKEIDLQSEIDFVSEKDLYDIVPVFSKGKIM